MSRLKIIALLCAIAAVLAVVVGQSAVATHEPADKAAAAASDIRPVNEAQPVLTEVIRVSSTSDLMLHTTSECSILTRLLTAGNDAANSTESDGAFGQVKMYITIDGNRVPVSTDDTPAPPPEETDTDGQDAGEVVFCNRAYQRTVTDAENDGDGIDGESDYIRTRTANAFNWMAFDVGKAYDEATYTTGGGTQVTGNNVVAIELWAEYDHASTSATARCASGGSDGDIGGIANTQDTCALAMIGSRSLIVDPTHASNHELPAPAPNTGN